MRQLLRLEPAERGSLLVAALLLFSLLLVLGLGLMSSQTSRVSAARAQTQGTQAKALALAGWEDVKTKLGKDVLFPLAANTQSFLSYSENVYDFDGVYVGSYTVVVDLRWHSVTRLDDATNPDPTDPNFESKIFKSQSIYPITCIGKVANGRVEEILAERVLYFELDMTTFRVIRMEDRGSL